jgi:8-oxo-dGTP diphosphatase
LNMKDFRVAAKAFIVKDGKLLVIKRRPNDVHKPGQWDIPGGRMEPGENPMEGLIREVQEEASITIKTVIPFDVHHFTRDDGQVITMIIFLCLHTDGEIKLSEEHTEYKWVDMQKEPELLPDWIKVPVKKYFDHVKT